MKSLKIFAITALLSLSLPAMAQLNSSNTQSADTQNSCRISDYNRIDVGYDAFITNLEGFENELYNGFRVQYLHGFKLSKKVPVYLELGLGLNSNFMGEDEDRFSLKFKHLAVSVPVNIATKIGNNKFKFSQYTGLNLKVNALAKATLSYMGEDEDINYFDEYDMGDDDFTWSRFQIGWQVGVGFEFVNKARIGVEYGIDILELADDCRSSHVTASVGFIF